MPTPTTAELSTPIAFPEDVGTTLWQERRTVPVTALYGVPLAFAVVLAVTVSPLVAKIALAVVAAGLGLLLWRARRFALIETFTVTDRYLTIVQPTGGRVALPVSSITSVLLRGEKVRLESSLGVVTLGFVRRQRALERALRQASPLLSIDREIDAFCPT